MCLWSFYFDKKYDNCGGLCGKLVARGFFRRNYQQAISCETSFPISSWSHCLCFDKHDFILILMSRFPFPSQEHKILWLLPQEKEQQRWPGVMRQAAFLTPQASFLWSQISALLALLDFSAWTASSFNLWHLYKLGFSRGRKINGIYRLTIIKGFYQTILHTGRLGRPKMLVCMLEREKV